MIGYVENLVIFDWLDKPFEGLATLMLLSGEQSRFCYFLLIAEASLQSDTHDLWAISYIDAALYATLKREEFPDAPKDRYRAFVASHPLGDAIIAVHDSTRVSNIWQLTRGHILVNPLP